MMGTSFLMAVEADMSSFLPTLDGWNKKGNLTVYTPDNLYEYIDGAAEVFLAYDFVRLGSQNYENGEKGSVTVDIYQHNNDRNGFGIYSQEKPQSGGNFLNVGAQGYYEQGVLNFLKGPYYVKISGYDLGDKDYEVLLGLAKATADKLNGTTAFPTVVKCFPEANKLKETEKYIAQNFLGHSFLHSAFIADYDSNGKKYQVFIMETKDQSGVNEILQKYLEFIKKKGITPVIEENNYIYHFEDPYYKSSGTMNMALKGNYLWGLFSSDSTLTSSIMNEIEAKLKENKLI